MRDFYVYCLVFFRVKLCPNFCSHFCLCLYVIVSLKSSLSVVALLHFLASIQNLTKIVFCQRALLSAATITTNTATNTLTTTTNTARSVSCIVSKRVHRTTKILSLYPQEGYAKTSLNSSG